MIYMWCYRKPRKTAFLDLHKKNKNMLFDWVGKSLLIRMLLRREAYRINKLWKYFMTLHGLDLWLFSMAVGLVHPLPGRLNTQLIGSFRTKWSKETEKVSSNRKRLKRKKSSPEWTWELQNLSEPEKSIHPRIINQKPGRGKVGLVVNRD